MRRLPVGAEVQRAGGVHFRVWAPKRRCVEVAFVPGGATLALEAEGAGYFSGLAPMAAAGDFYCFRLDGGGSFPDPASRFQPEGPHGPSQVVDPTPYAWRDSGWPGVALPGQVFYEMHIGTFTGEGTWSAASRQLPALRDLGVTVLELMPVADFSGRFGWGYDGVNPFAPTRLYGTPDDCRRFVDEAHALGLGVILDTVYNHFGADGNYLGQYSDGYATDRHRTDWGAAPDFDGDDSGPVREYFLANAACWIGEYHLDGLRLDATHAIRDGSADHILAAIGRRVREAAGGRSTIVVAEDETQDAGLARPPERGGLGLDAMWNDDLHHAAMAALTGNRFAYLGDYRGTPQELLSAARHGFLYQGQHSRWHGRARGAPARDLDPSAFITFLQNHDQVANAAQGRRGHTLTSAGRWRAMTAYLLLGPGTPLLFQGQEFSASGPFFYFADVPELEDAIRRGRRELLERWGMAAESLALADPLDPRTFARCALSHAEREQRPEAWRLHRDLLRLRRDDAVIAKAGRRPDGAVLGPQAFLLRYDGEGSGDRLVLVNLGDSLALDPASEPLLAPPEGRRWSLLWSSEDAAYGGGGALPAMEDWRLPAESAAVLAG